MTSEDKRLLLKEICARAPHGVICTDLRHGDSKITEVDIEDDLIYCFDFDEHVKIENCRLYLRPMSSMTEKEKKEHDFYCGYKPYDENIGESYLTEYDMPDYIDFLYEHHLDFRGLIPKGLAIEASKDMYNIK